MITLFISFGCHREGRPDLVMINAADPESLDPAEVVCENRAVNELFEGLVRFNGAGEIVPGVASSWEVSSNGKIYTFHLRKDAKWSNGESLTAGDFLYSWERALLPKTGCAYNYQYFVIEGAEDFANGKNKDFSYVGIKVIDPLTLQVTLKAPTPYFLHLCSYCTFFPVPQKAIEQFGDSWTKPSHMVSNGPYQLLVWRINDKIIMTKNPYYWNDAHVALKTVEMLPLTQSTVAYNFYGSGAADLLLDKLLIPPFLMREIQKRADFHSYPYLGSYFLRLNTTRPPFSDVRVREAFSLCVDAVTVTKKLAPGGEVPATSFIPPGIKGYEPATTAQKDFQKARQLMAESGYPGGKQFPLVHYIYTESELNNGIAVELQSVWEKVLGVRVLLNRQEWKVCLNSMNRFDYDIASSTWTGDYLDPNTFLDIFTKDAGNNRTGWSSSRYDQLLKEAAASPDPVARMKLLHQAEAILITHGGPIIPIFYLAGIQLYDATKLGGMGHNLLNKNPVSEIYRIKGSRINQKIRDID